VLSLRDYQLDPSFLWAPRAACAAVFAWVRSAAIAQSASTCEAFAELPDDCAGDVLEFILVTHLSRQESLHIATHSPSPEAHAWLHAVVNAAIAVSFCFFFNIIFAIQRQ